jgi:hypothetical protein
MPQPLRSNPLDGARAKRVRDRAGFRTTVLWAALLAGTALSAPGASAATATEDQARAVERELHDWLQGLLGGAVAAPERPVQLTPEGGDYALVIPLGTDAAITGHLTPQDDGRWLLTSLKIPSPATFTLSVPSPAKDGQPPVPTEQAVQISVARQETTGVLDPTYRTASSLQQRYEGMQVNVSGGELKRSTQTAHSTSQTTLTPVADGRFDLTSTAAFDGYVMDTQDKGLAIHVAADRGRATAQLSGISSDQGPALLRSSIAFVAETLADVNNAGGNPDRFTTEQQARLRTGLRAVVEALDGFASGMQAEYQVEGLQAQAGGFTGIARRASVGFGGSTPDGVLTTYLDLGVEGLSIPGLLSGLNVPPQYADLIPTDVHVRPTLTGIGTNELLGLGRQALDAMDQGRQPAPPDPGPLFAHGGIVAGVDAVSFNLGPTKFAGRGTVTFTAPAPDAFTGQGQVTATNFDALMDRAKRDPTMRQALAVLTFAKGIGRNDGDRLVWDITWQDGKALVNGVDVMAMANNGPGGNRGGSSRPPAQMAPPPAPAPAPTPTPSAPAPHAPGLSGKPPPK